MIIIVIIIIVIVNVINFEISQGRDPRAASSMARTFISLSRC